MFAGISPILTAAVFAVLSAFGVKWLSKRKDMREDSAIAVFWTLGMALGIMFSFLSPGFAPDLSAYLFGNILTINQGDLWMLGILALILTGFFYLFIRPIVCIAFDREFARSQKIPVEMFEYVLMMFIALFGVTLGWLPVAGRGELASYVLPVLSLSISAIAVLSRIVRSSL